MVKVYLENAFCFLRIVGNEKAPRNGGLVFLTKNVWEP